LCVGKLKGIKIVRIENVLLLSRYKLVGPDGSTYCASQDADIIGGSDADDV